MACTTGIVKSIVSNCSTQPIAGLEQTVYLWKRGDISVTYDSTYNNKVTGLSKLSAKAYKLTGHKKNINAGHDPVFAEDRSDLFNHYLSIKGYQFSAEDIENLDGLNDICAVVEYKNKTSNGDGIYVGYGFKTGLYKSTDIRRANDQNSARSIELVSQSGEDEPYSQYNILITDYATTKTTLEALTIDIRTFDGTFDNTFK